MEAILREKGFRVGHSIIRPVDKTRAVIVSVLDTRVRLDVDGKENALSGQYDISVNALLQGEWKPVKKAPAVLETQYANFKDSTALHCKALNEMVAKGEVARRLWEVETQHQKTLECLTLKLTPIKGVIVNKGFKVGKLAFAPATYKIVTFKEGVQGLTLGKIRDVSLMVSSSNE